MVRARATFSSRSISKLTAVTERPAATTEMRWCSGQDVIPFRRFFQLSRAARTFRLLSCYLVSTKIDVQSSGSRISSLFFLRGTEKAFGHGDETVKSSCEMGYADRLGMDV